MSLSPGCAEADDGRHGNAVPGPPQAFDLHLAREDLTVDFRDDSGAGDLEVTRLGIAFHETVARGVRGAVNLGAMGVRERDREATADVDPTGWYLGLDFDGIWPADGLLRLNTGIGWRFARADRSDDDGNETHLDWHMAEARAALVTVLDPSLGLRFGAAYQWLRGDERIRGETSRTTRFDMEEPVSGYVQLDILTGRGGAIRFRAYGGNPRGARISFEVNY